MFALLLASLLSFQSGPQNANAQPYRGWWLNPNLYRSLGIEQGLAQELAPKLENIEKEIQLGISELQRTNRKIAKSFLDPEADPKQIQKNHQKLVQLRTNLHKQRFQARFLVRQALSAKQLEIITQHASTFFRSPWFRRSDTPVYRGKVRKKKP